MKAPLRIAVLECDTPLTQTKAKYGGYGGVFEVLLQSGAKALNQPELVHPESGLEITKWDIVNGDQYPNLDDVDGILITGSSMSDPKRRFLYGRVYEDVSDWFETRTHSVSQ